MAPQGALAPAILAILVVFRQALADDFEKKCGDCWCILVDSESSCPDFSPGHYDSFSESVQQAYASLKLEGEAPELKAADGTECNPFTHVDPGEKNPKANLPQCAEPEMYDDDDAVCAFHYLNEGEDCEDTKYEMKTFGSLGDVPGDWVVTHQGACGVCSSAADLAVMGNKDLVLNKASESCGSLFFVGSMTKNADENFDSLHQCFKDIGYTDSCSLLWAHTIATNVPLCAEICSTTLGKPYNGDPPGCERNDCLLCTEGHTSERFITHSGRTSMRSGLTEAIARPCQNFPSSIAHEPTCIKDTNDTPPLDTNKGTPPADDNDNSAAKGLVAVKTSLVLIVFGSLLLIEKNVAF